MSVNPWFVLLALAIGWWLGHAEGLRCGCADPRKVNDCDCKSRGAWGAKASENHYTDCPRFPGGKW